jgi:ubiquinone/menaquinone biosynthesis C-methylase UbiE
VQPPPPWSNDPSEHVAPVALLPDVSPAYSDDVAVFLHEEDLAPSDHKELAEQRSYTPEHPDLDLFTHTVAKATFISVFQRLLPMFQLRGGERVLELGAGRGWASTMLKQAHGSCYVVATDLSPVPVSRVREYEELLGVQLDERWACAASALPFADEQFDLVFTFAAFHHLIIGDRYRTTLAEALRVLRPNGRMLLLYEPSAPRYLYRLAHWRVSQRPGVDEDVLLLPRLRDESARMGLSMTAQYFPDPFGRSSAAALFYYYVLSRVPWLAPLLPCTVNVELRKARAPPRRVALSG